MGLKAQSREMVRWFSSNFSPFEDWDLEDLLEWEREYKLGNTVRHGVLDVLIDKFPDAYAEAISSAVAALEEGEALEWIATEGGFEFEEQKELEDVDPKTVELDHQLDELEPELDQIGRFVDKLLEIPSDQSIGIGHNLPPEEANLDHFNLIALRRSIDEIKEELAKPSRVAAADLAVVEGAQSGIGSLKNKLKWLTSAFAAGIVGGAGKLAFDHLAASPTIMHSIDTALTILARWIHLIQP